MMKLNEIHTSSHPIVRFLHIIYVYVEVLMRPVVLIRFQTQAATFAAAAELVWEPCTDQLTNEKEAHMNISFG